MIKCCRIVVHVVRISLVVKILVDILMLSSGRYGLSSRLLITEGIEDWSIPRWMTEALIMHLLKEIKSQFRSFARGLFDLT